MIMVVSIVSTTAMTRVTVTVVALITVANAWVGSGVCCVLPNPPHAL